MGEFSQKALGRRIAYLRKKLGLKQKDLASFLGKTVAAVASWEVGRNLVPTDVVAKLVKEYKVNPLWLFFGEGSMFLKEVTSEIEEEKLRLLKKLKGKFLLIKETADDMIKSGKYQVSAGKKLEKLLEEILGEE